MKLNPHFTFNSRAKEALEFYTSALRARQEIVYTYGDCRSDLPAGVDYEEHMERIMYSLISFGEGNRIAICDMCPGSEPEKAGNTVFMDLELKAECVKPIFDALSAGGTVLCALAETSWSKQFGCLTDKFGICWNIMQEEEPK